MSQHDSVNTKKVEVTRSTAGPSSLSTVTVGIGNVRQRVAQIQENDTAVRTSGPPPRVRKSTPDSTPIKFEEEDTDLVSALARGWPIVIR